MLKIAVLAMATGLAVAATGCSDNRPADSEGDKVTKPAAESGETIGQAAVKIAVDPRSGNIMPGGLASAQVQALQQAPEYRISNSPVSGGLLSSSAGFMTPLTAKIGCDGKLKIAHADLSLTGDSDCGQGEVQ